MVPVVQKHQYKPDELPGWYARVLSVCADFAWASVMLE